MQRMASSRSALAGLDLWRVFSTMTTISYAGYRFPPEIIQQAIWLALSRYRMQNARDLRLAYFQATATAARHMFVADARKARCVLAEARWRWTKVL